MIYTTKKSYAHFGGKMLTRWLGIAAGLTLPALLLQACTGFEDAQRVMATRGPAQVYPDSSFAQDSTLEAQNSTHNPNLVGLFVDSYVVSFAAPDDQAKALIMARRGYDLVHHYCEQFFDAGGENQKWLDLSKDIVAALGTLGTGISALAAPNSASTTAAIALGVATAYNGIDIYTRNFLFGAANIDSVRTVTLNALAAHRKATIDTPAPASDPWTFGNAILQIEDHQALCQSAKIRALVLEAVKGGTVIAFTPSGQLATAGGPVPPGAPAPPIAPPPPPPPAPIRAPAPAPGPPPSVGPGPSTHVNVRAGS